MTSNSDTGPPLGEIAVVPISEPDPLPKKTIKSPIHYPSSEDSGDDDALSPISYNRKRRHSEDEFYSTYQSKTGHPPPKRRTLSDWYYPSLRNESLPGDEDSDPLAGHGYTFRSIIYHGLKAGGAPVSKKKDLVLDTTMTTTMTPDQRFEELRGPFPAGVLNEPENLLNVSTMRQSIACAFDWKFVVCGEVENNKKRTRGFYFGLGGSTNYFMDNLVWNKVEIELVLDKDTLVYGEFVHEYIDNGEPKLAFHIIDGLVLGGTDIRTMHYMQRLEMCSKLANKLSKPSGTDIVQVKVKDIGRMEKIGDLFENLALKCLGNNTGSKLYCPLRLDDDTASFPIFHPTGLLFLLMTKDPWRMAWSRSMGKKYWFNTLDGQSTYELPVGAIADFCQTMESRKFWKWNSNTQLGGVSSLCQNTTAGNGEEIHAGTIRQHVEFLLA